MVKLLGPKIVGVIAEVYLDDLIVVANTLEECARNVDIIMEKFAYYNFRINFSKCVFTPSTDIDFLGCRFEGNTVHPGPKVATVLKKIIPPHQQLTLKARRFEGNPCAGLLDHAPFNVDEVPLDPNPHTPKTSRRREAPGMFPHPSYPSWHEPCFQQ
jgi:hypothetical protein